MRGWLSVALIGRPPGVYTLEDGDGRQLGHQFLHTGDGDFFPCECPDALCRLHPGRRMKPQR